MKNLRFLIVILFTCIHPDWIQAQVDTAANASLDLSLFWKKSGAQESLISSDKGNLFLKLGHHGPALENLWVAYRVYFNDAGAVDIFSKFEPRLELKDTKWYPSKTQKEENYGSDNFSVGNTVGLGGVKLWDGENFSTLGPVSNRTAEVELNDSLAQIRMTSYSVPYQGKLLDILFSLTCFSNGRHAIIEVSELNGIPVQFATGLAAYSNLEIEKTENYVMTWGDYNSHEKHAVFNLGTALIYNPNEFEDSKTNGDEYLLISKPTSYLKYVITSSNDKEASDLNNFSSFEAYVEELEKMVFD